jgi:hypothetical protein
MPVEPNQNNMDFELEKKIDKMLDEKIQKYTDFTARKVTDTPNDSLSVVNRRYVTLNGVSANRPTSSVVGQQYLDMTLAAGNGKPIYWNGTGWIDSSGTYV